MICLFFASAFSASTCSSDGKTYTIIDDFVTVQSNFVNKCPDAETLIIKDAMTITFQSGDAFQNSKLKVIKMTSDMSITLQSEIFTNLASLQTVTLTSDTISVQGEVFKGSGVQTVTLTGDTSATIQRSAFENCKSLETVKMSAKSVSIQGDSFKGSGVQSVTLTGSTSATIQGSSFANCKSLETVEMSAKSVTIQGTSFHYCSSLNSVKLTGSTSVTIQNNPFCGCTNLKGNIEAITDKFTFQESSAFQCDGSEGGGGDDTPSVPSPTPAPIKYTISATVNGEFRPLEISIVDKDGYGTGCMSAQLLEKYDITITSDIPEKDIPDGYKIALNYDKTKYEVDKSKLSQKMSDAIEEKQISGSGDGGKKGGGISMAMIIGIVVAVVVVVVIIIVVVVVVKKKKNKKQTSDAEVNEEQLP